jgi:serine/threonine protein kinase
VLVDRDETTKVADFGLSRETVEDVYEVTKGGKIPVRWTAPEAIAYRKFTTSSDVWSFGVLLWEVMSYCQQPYDGWDNQTVLSMLENGHRLEKPKDCPDTVYNCMLECWNAEARKRPSFEQVVRILEILLEGNLSEGPKPKPRLRPPPSSGREVVSPLEYESVEEWLQSIKMQRYTDNFLESGHISIASCLELTADDLTKMNVTLAGHQNKIITSIRMGRDQFERQNSLRI